MRSIPRHRDTYGIAPPAFRLPDATHVGRVYLQVSDLHQSIAYYERVLGLHVYDATTDTAALGPRGDHHPLVLLQTSNGVVPARRGAFGLYHFAILLPKRAALGRFASHLSAHGVRVDMADHLVSESLYLWDPDGLGIEVYADRPRTAWRQRNRELLIATEPLDIRSVIAAAGDRPWDGMPTGTTIGHMHLHVGRLDDAEAFYHAALGFDKTAWNYPGALFFAAGGYHHHLGTNVWSAGPRAKENEARLVEWELVVPSDNDASAVANSLRASGYVAGSDGDGYSAADPWGTRLRVVAAVHGAESQ
jgi:catechol 2,3-dioxygenase